MAIRGKSAIMNLLRVYSALAFSLLFSLMMSFYAPKILGVEEFSYWQLFLFYTTYTGLLHLGLIDGIYLTYGGKTLDMEDCHLISGQLWFLICALTVLVCITIVVFFIINPSIAQLKPILVFVGLYAIISNGTNYCCYLLQAINQFKIYTKGVIIDKIFAAIGLLMIGILHIDSYKYLCLIYIVGSSITFSYVLYKCRSIFFEKFIIAKELFRNIWKNIKCGIDLMISNIASNFIIGICRFLISICYPIVTFGYVSFSFTLTNFVLIFMSQIGVAIYPILKSKDESFHKPFFMSVNRMLSLTLPFCFIFYPVLVGIVTAYLPQYEVSLSYFAYLFPVVVFEAKISSLYNTYMKVLRKEKSMLYINLIASGLSILISLFAIVILKNIILSLVGVGIAIFIKSELYNFQIHKHFKLPYRQLGTDTLLALLYYMLLIFSVNMTIIIVCVLLTDMVLCLYNRKYIKNSISIFYTKR